MRTRKALSTAGIVIGSLIALYVTFIIVFMFWSTADNRIASSPDRIARHAGFSLPGYEVSGYSDNSDRGSSAWSCTEWTLALKEPVSAELRSKLEHLASKDGQWRYDMLHDAFHYVMANNGRDDSPEVQITLCCRTGTVKMSYSWWDFLA